MQTMFRGSFTALITPFRGGGVDEEAFRQTMADEGRLIYRFDVQRTYGLR